MALAKNRTDHRKFMDHLSDEAQQCLCGKIQSLQWRGILGDWGYAVPIASSSIPPTSETQNDDDSSDCPSTSPIEAKPDNLVPVQKIGSNDAPSLVSASNLMVDDNIYYFTDGCR